MSFELPGGFSVVRAVLDQGLAAWPVDAVEETLKGLRHLHPAVVLVHAIQFLKHQAEAVLVVGGGVRQVLHLLPDWTSQRRQQVDGRLGLLIRKRHLLVVQVHPLAIFLIGARLPIEHRDVVVVHHLRIRRGAGGPSRRRRLTASFSMVRAATAAHDRRSKEEAQESGRNAAPLPT